MKNLALLFVLLLAFTTSTVAAPILDVTVSSKGKTISLTFLNKKIGATETQKGNAQKQKVVLKDLYGVTLYSETVNTSLVPKKIYNLDNLPSGEYIFEVHYDTKVILKPFGIVQNEIIINSEKTIFKPTIIVKDNIANVNFLTLNNPAKITITDTLGEILYSNKIEDSPYFGKRFDFRTAEKGSYTINTFVADQEFRKTIIVD